MYHLYRHEKGKLKGKLDFAFITNGRYISGSSQGYENKMEPYKAMMAIAKYHGSVAYQFQDDTGIKPVMMYAVINAPKKNLIITTIALPTKKKYIPNK